jgi:hypothetical protein
MQSTDRYVGVAGDFAFLEGTFRVRHRQLRRRLAGCTDWDEVESGYRGFQLADGGISVDEFRFPDGATGCAFRALDRKTRRWSIWWVASRDGRLGLPVHGGFDGSIGEFYGDDSQDGASVKVRFVWRRPPDHAPRWEQAFSRNGDDWEVNWVMEFARTDSGRRDDR